MFWATLLLPSQQDFDAISVCMEGCIRAAWTQPVLKIIKLKPFILSWHSILKYNSQVKFLSSLSQKINKSIWFVLIFNIFYRGIIWGLIFNIFTLISISKPVSYCILWFCIDILSAMRHYDNCTVTHLRYLCMVQSSCYSWLSITSGVEQSFADECFSRANTAAKAGWAQSTVHIYWIQTSYCVCVLL